MNRETTTRFDLCMRRITADSDADEELDDLTTISALGNGQEQKIQLSHIAKSMQADIKASVEECDTAKNHTGLLQTTEENAKLYTRWTNDLNDVLKDSRADKKWVEEVDEGIQEVLSKFHKKVNDKWGVNGGGKGKMELAAQTAPYEKPSKRMRGQSGL